MIEWLKRKFGKRQKFLIWGIIEGPVRAEDVPDSHQPPGTVSLILKYSHGDLVGEAEFWFDDFNEAYKIMKHFHYTIEPLEMNVKEFELVR